MPAPARARAPDGGDRRPSAPTRDRISPTSSRSDSTRGPSGSAGRRPSAILGRGSVCVQHCSAGLYEESTVAHPSNAHTRPASNRAVLPVASRLGCRQRSAGPQNLCLLPSRTPPRWRPHDAGAASHGTFPRGRRFQTGFSEGDAGTGRPMEDPGTTTRRRDSVRPRQPRAPRPRWGPRPSAARPDSRARRSISASATVRSRPTPVARRVQRPSTAASVSSNTASSASTALASSSVAARHSVSTSSSRKPSTGAHDRTKVRTVTPSAGSAATRNTNDAVPGRSCQILSPTQRRDDLVQPREAEEACERALGRAITAKAPPRSRTCFKAPTIAPKPLESMKVTSVRSSAILSPATSWRLVRSDGLVYRSRSPLTAITCHPR